MAFKGLLMVIQWLLRAIQGLYSRPSGATPSPCGSSLVAAPPCMETSGSCLRPGTRGHVTAAPGTGQLERPVGSQGVSVEKAALSPGCGAMLGAALAAVGSRGGLLPAGPSPGSSRIRHGEPRLHRARQSTLGARPASLGTILSSVPLYGFFQALCEVCTSSRSTAELLPASLALHPSSQQCHLARVWDEACSWRYPVWDGELFLQGSSVCCVIWPLLSLHQGSSPVSSFQIAVNWLIDIGSMLDPGSLDPQGFSKDSHRFPVPGMVAARQFHRLLPP